MNISNRSFIGGGDGNQISNSNRSLIVGGASNTIEDPVFFNTTRNTIVGGFDNLLSTTYSAEIVGGQNNKIVGEPSGFFTSSIVGGLNNSIYKSRANFIGNGEYNVISGQTFSFIGSGYQNKVISDGTGGGNWASVIGGGSYNQILGGGISTSTIVGGGYNTINAGVYAGVAGGYGNTVNSDYGVTFGSQNTVSSDNGVVIGGKLNTIGTGSSYSSILGGENNIISGHTNSHIIGSNITSVSANTTHVERLNIGTIGSGTPQINLGVDAIGNVVTGTTGAFKYIVEFNTNQDGSVETIPLSAITAAGGIPVGYIEGGGASAKCDFNIECWTQINEPGPSGEWFKGDSSSLLSITVNESTGLITITTTGGALDIILRVVITG
jgi:hypothetical protein